MEQLLGLVITVVAILTGIDYIKRRKPNRLAKMAEELDVRELREAYLKGRAGVRVDMLERRIQEREDQDELVEDEHGNAADRLRREFGAED